MSRRRNFLNFQNITCWLNTWISVRSLDLKVGITYLKFLENILPGIWNISAFLANFFFHLQFCSAATMSVHRISSILFFTHYEKFWSRWYPLINLFLVGYSCLSQVEGQPVRLDLINGSVYLDSNLELWYATNNRLFVFSVVYFVVILLLGLIVARMAFKKLQGTNADQGVSRKLTKIALTYGLVYSGILFWNIANMIQVRMNIMPVFALKIGNALMGLASDMMTLSLPYILLIFDSNIKRDIRFSRESSSVNPAVPSIY
ncbi:unnamed protein product [Caenorhabditis brenneri]